MCRPTTLSSSLPRPHPAPNRQAWDRAGVRQQQVAHGAWSFVHGFTTLWLAGNLDVPTLPEAIAEFRRLARTFTRIGLQ